MATYFVEKIPYQMLLYSPLKKEGIFPEEGSELYIKNIPCDATVEELLNFLEKIDKVYEIRLMMTSDFVFNRRFAYASYFQKEVALKAQKILCQIKFREEGNVYLCIQQSFNNRRIFLGNIPTNKTKDEVWRELETLGNMNIVDVIMYRSYSDRAENRGYVFVEFKTHEHAAYFRAKNASSLQLWGRDIVVDWSVPCPEPDEDTMNKVKKLFLRNLDVVTTVEDVQKMLLIYVHPDRVEKVYKFKNYAFIHLKTREEAEDLFHKLNGHFLKTAVEVTWAKPSSQFTNPVYRQKKVQSREREKSVKIVRSKNLNNTSSADLWYTPTTSRYSSSEEEDLYNTQTFSSNSSSVGLEKAITRPDPLLLDISKISLNDLPARKDFPPLPTKKSILHNYFTPILSKPIPIKQREVNTNYFNEYKRKNPCQQLFTDSYEEKDLGLSKLAFFMGKSSLDSQNGSFDSTSPRHYLGNLLDNL